MMKRGVHVDFLNFITPPSTDPKSALKVHEIIKFTTRYQTHARLFQINFSKLLNLIALTEKTSYRINLMRRSFYRIADQICQRESYLGISNGESLGQVASQTLESIATISSQTQLPIYRPLLTFDKLEIIAKAKKYGTYDFSILPAQETCELFAPTSPTTQPKQIVAAKLEAKMQPFLSQLEEDALQNQCLVYEFTQSKR
ncbi:uncharacterized protein LOC111627216 [Centruroides sculpturatus]|uniref:uncharacterized protein LOC111627216 n=1 Tax=Centruroides sculpturatus TaxID=218467 RepID=UPI000C6E024D|nr:uncharacterized protein LOC111627216 [Centruroides sculpturatus]